MSRADQFGEGFFFAVRAPGQEWGCRQSETEQAPASWTEVEGLEVHAIDRPPEAFETFDGSGAWEPDLVALQEARWAQAKTVRDARVNGGCITSAGWVDTDLVSRTNINGAVAAAQLAGESFSIAWRLQSNDTAALDAAGMIQMGAEVGQFVAACYSASFAISAAIEAAGNAGAIAAVDIEAGYPGGEA